MRCLTSSLALAAALALSPAALAGEVPASPDQIAEPGGDLPGDPEIALVKVADGFLDPINVTNAGDGSGPDSHGVSDTVRQWVQNGVPNHGFFFVGPNEAFNEFGNLSRLSTASVFTLEVQFTD